MTAGSEYAEAGKAIALWRAGKKLSAVGAAEWLGFAETFYRDLEAGTVVLDPTAAKRVFEMTGVRLPELVDEDRVTEIKRPDEQRSAAAKRGVGAGAVPTPPAPDGGAATAAPAVEQPIGAVQRLEVLSIIATHRRGHQPMRLPTITLLSADRRDQYAIELSPDRAVRLAIELLQVAEAAR